MPLEHNGRVLKKSPEPYGKPLFYDLVVTSGPVSDY